MVLHPDTMRKKTIGDFCTMVPHSVHQQYVSRIMNTLWVHLQTQVRRSSSLPVRSYVLEGLYWVRYFDLHFPSTGFHFRNSEPVSRSTHKLRNFIKMSAISTSRAYGMKHGGGLAGELMPPSLRVSLTYFPAKLCHA